MSSPNPTLSMASVQQAALPVLTTLLMATGLLGGAYTFTSPTEGAKLFGLIPPTSTDKRIQAWQRAYIKVHGIRNFANGAAFFGLAGFWRFSSLCRSSPLAALAVKRSLGILLLAGAVVPVADGYVISEFTQVLEAERKDGGPDEALEVGRKQSRGHLFMTLPVMAIGLGWLLS